MMENNQDNLDPYGCGSGRDAASREQLNNLSHELDCLGLPTINVNVDILQQLMETISNLMSLYKKNVAQQQELQLQKTQIEHEKTAQQRVIENYNENLRGKDVEVQKLKESIRKMSEEISDLKTRNKSVNKEFGSLRLLYNRKEDENSHALMKLKLENNNLKERLGEEVGKYKSQDSSVIEALKKYKIKEGIYEDTIKKLQDNNEQLLNEILNLKEEVVMTLHNHPDCDY